MSETYNKEDFTSVAANRLVTKRRLHYMKKENRDRAFKLIKAAGLNARRNTSIGQSLHPEYVEDYTGALETGVGNTMYRTSFPVLYNLELTDKVDRRRKSALRADFAALRADFQAQDTWYK